MKRVITLRLCFVILLSMFVTAFLSYCLLVKSSREAMHHSSLIRINQIAQIIEKNDADIVQLKENLKEDYYIRAEAAAYIVQNYPEVTENLDEMKKVASLLQIDEIHLFDTEGTLYNGSEPKYYNYTFYSGEQMQFFLPMLNDYSLKLCQEVTPNTAEGKLMQYIAVWREDRKGIVQIGMEPKRLLDAMEKNGLSHIFTMIPVEDGLTIFAADLETGEILGASDALLAGKDAKELGFDFSRENLHKEVFLTEFNGEKLYCVVRQVGQVLVGVSSTEKAINQNISNNMVLVVISLFILSIVIILLILMMLDKFVINRIYEIISGMKKIAAGDLDHHVEVAALPEFVELSEAINSMVISLLGTTNKLSLVFQNVNIQIAVYEYNPDMKRVLATSKIGDILLLSGEELSKALANRDIFYEKIKEICENPYGQEKDVYQLKVNPPHYVRINSYQEGRSTLGVIVDVTEEIIEKQEIKQERDMDLLTGIYNRRAFYSELEHIFQNPAAIGMAAFLMVDLDNLKYINDHWGHEYGDRLLSQAADILKSCKAPNKVVSRFGGDEFALMIYGADSQEEIQGYLDDLYSAAAAAVILVPQKETVPVCMSGGYVFYPEYEKDYREMIYLADQAMYQVKNGTKGYFLKYEGAAADTKLVY